MPHLYLPDHWYQVIALVLQRLDVPGHIYGKSLQALQGLLRIKVPKIKKLDKITSLINSLDCLEGYDRITRLINLGLLA